MVNCPKYIDIKSTSKSEYKTNQNSIKCHFCSSSVPTFSSSKCNDCKKDFCLKHRLTFDHNCSNTYKVKTTNNANNVPCSHCKDNKVEVKPCSFCKNMLCINHLPSLNHNCLNNKKINMKESFIENKNKILNDLKMKKLQKTQTNNSQSNNENSNNDVSFIKSQAKGNQLIKEEDRVYLRIVQNCQLNFDEIKGFPIYRFYNKYSSIKEILNEIIMEFNLLDRYVLGAKNDVYIKDSFKEEMKLSEITSLKYCDTVMISKIL
jgi:hypothetical protein